MSREVSTQYYKQFLALHLDTTCIWQNVSSPFPHGEPVPFIGPEDYSHTAQLAMRSPSHYRATVHIPYEHNQIQRQFQRGLYDFTREFKGNTLPDFSEITLFASNELRNVITLNEAVNTIQAIEWLQDIGLPSEQIGSVHKVNSVMFNGEEIPVEEAFKKLLHKHTSIEIQSIFQLAKVLRPLANSLQIPLDDLFDFDTFISIPIHSIQESQYTFYDLASYWHDKIRQSQFFMNAVTSQILDLAVMERWFPMGERLEDMFYLDSKEGMLQYLDILFSKMNPQFEEYGRFIPGLPDFPTLDPNKQVDRLAYFTRFLPEQLGAYLAILHGNSMAHTNISPSNICALGFPVDPVTITGKHNEKQRGDVELLTKWISADTWSAAYSLIQTLAHYIRISYDSDSVDELEHECIALFVATYMEKRLSLDVEFANLPGRGAWVDRAWKSMFNVALILQDEQATLNRTKELLRYTFA